MKIKSNSGECLFIHIYCKLEFAFLCVILRWFCFRGICYFKAHTFLSVILQAGKSVTNVASTSTGKFIVKIEKRTMDVVDLIEADYVLIASGSSQMVRYSPLLLVKSLLAVSYIVYYAFSLQGYTIAEQLGHSIIDPIPSLFTFKIQDSHLTELAGVRS